MADTDVAALRGLLEQMTGDNEALNELVAQIAESQQVRFEDISPPSEFKQVDVDIETHYQCPKCSYRWSGKTE